MELACIIVLYTSMIHIPVTSGQEPNDISYKGETSKFLQLVPPADSVATRYQNDQDWPMEQEILNYLEIQSATSLISIAPTDPIIDEVTTLTDTPTVKSTNKPKPNPTANPTANPTDKPTKKPKAKTNKATDKPIPKPTNKPRSKKPTPNPTSQPTSTFAPTTSSPSYTRHDGFFDYNPESPHGPDEWSDVDVSDSEFFGYFSKFDNECNGPEQSPINVDPTRSCPDDHKINYKSGRPKFNTVDFVILPHVLRAYIEKPALNDDDDAIYLGTRADFSNLSEYIPAVHVDVKVPSEHHLFGKQYAGEMNIAHFFDKGRGRIVYITILMDDKRNKKNDQLELFIKEWEETALKQEKKCNNQEYKRSYVTPGNQEMRDIWQLTDKDKSDWDLYKFATTTYHCGYEGSLTEPPCSERAIYRVLDLPLQMSKNQTKRLQKLQTQTLDINCNIPAVSYEGGVNRPIQLQNDNSVYCCTSEDWPLKWNKEYWFSKWPKKYHGRLNTWDGN